MGGGRIPTLWNISYLAPSRRVHFFFISNQSISNQGSDFSKITIENNSLLLYLTIENKRKVKQLGLTQVAYKKTVYLFFLKRVSTLGQKSGFCDYFWQMFRFS